MREIQVPRGQLHLRGAAGGNPHGERDQGLGFRCWGLGNAPRQQDHVRGELVLLAPREAVGELGPGGHLLDEGRGLALGLGRGGDGEHEVPAVLGAEGRGMVDALHGAVDEDADAVAEHLRLLHGVRGEDQRAVLLGCLDGRPQAAPAGRVEAGGGLVEVHHEGVPDQGDCHREAAAHASAVLPTLLVPDSAVPQIDALEGRLHRAREGGPLEALEAAVEVEMLPPREILPLQVVLRAHPHHGIHAVNVVVDVGALDEDGSRVALEEAHHHVDGSRLARAVRPQEAEALAPGNLKGEGLARALGRCAVEGGVDFGDVVEDDGELPGPPPAHGGLHAGPLLSHVFWLLLLRRPGRLLLGPAKALPEEEEGVAAHARAVVHHLLDVPCEGGKNDPLEQKDDHHAVVVVVGVPQLAPGEPF
mmetsp:Transcript_26099/g.83304  ORF Transcript_26099/g.83304 Transcript_26099/m.83304 type:complete len:418 (+) Transcript_26099:748-2001(+)